MMRLIPCAAGVAMMAVLGTAAVAADQTFSGTVTILNRTTSEVVIRQTPSGETVGAATTGATEKFKLLTVPDSLHAGEKVTVTFTDAGGVKTISDVTEHKE